MPYNVLSSELTFGVIGSGQLGKMLMEAAHRLGFRTCVWGNEAGCGFDVATEKIMASYNDGDAMRRFCNLVDVAMVEFENVPDTLATEITHVSQGRVKLCPGRKALTTAQDRRLEKKMASVLGIPVGPYSTIRQEADLEQVTEFPVILKTVSMGYDGKGQRRVERKEDLAEAWASLGRYVCVAERVVDFETEFSTIITRWPDGSTVHYEPFKNIHRDGILTQTIWPYSELCPTVREQTIAWTKEIARYLNLVGLLTVEWFLTPEGALFNEIAPRPHNSGHITIDCAVTSQFENAVRAAFNLRPGDTSITRPGRMFNILGEDAGFNGFDGQPGVRVYRYNKDERPGTNRKLGHVVKFNPFG